MIKKSKNFSKILENLRLIWYIKKAFENNRGVAQLVARVVWDHEVAGSIPVTSTIKRSFLQAP